MLVEQLYLGRKFVVARVKFTRFCAIIWVKIDSENSWFWNLPVYENTVEQISQKAR